LARTHTAINLCGKLEAVQELVYVAFAQSRPMAQTWDGRGYVLRNQRDITRGENQTARRRRFRSAPAVPVLRVLRPRVCPRHPRQLRVQAARRTAAEAVKTALSPHPVAAAQLLQLPPPRPQLAAPAPHLLQGRAHRRRNQPALPDYQLPRSRLRGLRFLQRSRRVREPHRGVSRTASAPTA